MRRRRKTDAKRRQRGETFMDQRIVHVRAGVGGDGCVAFHREKWKPMGPPSGGNGGAGSSVYLLPTPHLTTLSSVRRIVKGAPGGTGGGTWRNGKDAEPTIIRVPLGTVVRQLPFDDPRRAKDAWERFEERLEGLDPEERLKKIRERRWVHYPGFEDDNLQRETFKEADRMLAAEERAIRMRRLRRGLIHLDLDKAVETPETERDADAPLGLPRTKNWGYLIAEGGAGGLGNPHFLSKTNRSPKTASRGMDGEWVSLELELKILADVALVGMPNAGKSTLVRALTGGRVKSEVAGWAFTTLNRVVGVVRIGPNGWVGGEEGKVYDETALEQGRLREGMDVRGYVDGEGENSASDASHQEQVPDSDRPSYDSTIGEKFRFTITDNPGLIEHASENKGLGHSFLRSIERSHALVYVVDLSCDAPWEELRVLRDELEKYREGMSGKARMIIANKADLLGADGGEDVEEARRKLARLEDFVKTEMRLEDGEGRTLDVVPVSAKYSMNLRKVVDLMVGYVEEARSKVALQEDNESSLLQDGFED
ncbi:GTP-binding protein Obg/CgtA [Gloeophyllum trabeum ATCC 11539]|uniref:GTP-binding protein Obg/CgtA n=1 Tax=Gloeophyllum trabeum (strain ATCC 11539 / FP-39264 / Madison 617) TaxID=670483 RepID=S7PWN6_GLOTA|nr:GTP-binding protein Obg/CgtA [Gloeophyllum trabeum ATCC 11539]EPQ51797.1 GTP-binding protein Obg/CgtA [Gloeophyllum trabeum ATCC 11539]